MKKSFQHGSKWKMLALKYALDCERKGVYLAAYALMATLFYCDKVGKKQ